MENGNFEKSIWDKTWNEKQAGYEQLICRVESFKRTALIEKFFSKDDKILEAGCGDGKFVFYFHSKGYNIKGIDYVDTAIERNINIAEKACAKSDLFDVADIRDLTSIQGQFDIYLSMGVIEHFKRDEQQLIIKQARATLKKNGKVVVTVPNLFSPWTITRHICAFFSKKMPYQKNISKFKIRKMFENEGFETIAVFNAEVREALTLALRVNQKNFKGIPNPLYLIKILLCKITTPKILGIRNPLLFVRKGAAWLVNLLDKVVPIIGYNTYYVGQVD